MENEEQVSPAVVEKVSISTINAEKTAIKDEENNIIIDEILIKIADMTDDEKDEMITYLKADTAKRKKHIEELEKKKAGI